MYLLGLTATPTYTGSYRYGWLEKLFPQRIIYQVTAQKLMADGILSKPEIEQHQTNFEVSEFDEEEYKKLLDSYEDLPEHIISKLAENRDRNIFIAETYVVNKERYGKTIIFADRWFQCEQLREFLENRGIRAGVVYSGVKGIEREKIRNISENARILEAFRRHELDVLINVRMLTEGTDIPDVQTVFITRETKSNILLTQMVGRALRGPRMGGTEKAYIVAFIDIWQYEIKWAGYAQILPGIANNDNSDKSLTSPQIILADLVRRLAQQMDRSIDSINGSFLTLLPLGWYKVEFSTIISESEIVKIVTELIMVFEGEKEAYERFIKKINSEKSKEFIEVDIQSNDKYQIIKDLCIEAFDTQDTTVEVIGEWINENLLKNLLYIACHVTQNEGKKPPFFLFEERKNHDLDELAKKFLSDDLGPRALDRALQVEFNREDRYWKIIYYSYELFKQHYNACVDKLLAREQYVSNNNQILPFESSVRAAEHQLKINEEQLDEIKEDKPFSVSDLPMPKQISSLEQWKDFVCKSINLCYKCDVVESFKLSGSGQHPSWIISLDTGTKADLIKPHLEMLMQKIQMVLEPVGYISPKIICVDNVSVEMKNNYGQQIKQIRKKPLRYTQTEWILKIAIGDKILVNSGQFKGIEGEVIKVNFDLSKIEAILSIPNRATSVELDFKEIQKKVVKTSNRDNYNSFKIEQDEIQETILDIAKTPNIVSNDNKTESIGTLEKSIEGSPQEIINRIVPKTFLKQYLDGERIFHNINLRETNLNEANLSKAILWKADLSGANLIKSNLNSASLYQANLEKAELKESELNETNFREANLVGVSLNGANLQKSNLSKANLTNANLDGANLQQANLQEANLTGANLSGANLQGANLHGANLSDANLDGANLQKTNLVGAIMPDGTISDQIEIKILEQSIINYNMITTRFLNRFTGSTYSLMKKCQLEFSKSLNGSYDLLIVCPSKTVQQSLELKIERLTNKFQDFVGDFSTIILCTIRDPINLNNLAHSIPEWFLKDFFPKNERKYACIKHKSHNWYIIMTFEQYLQYFKNEEY